MQDVFSYYPGLSYEELDKYDALIFDLDGTLLDTIPPHSKAWVEAGEHFGYPFDPNVMIRMTGKQPIDICRAVMEEAGMPLDKVEEVLKVKMDLAFKYCFSESKELPIMEVVRHYAGKKPLAIATGSTRKFLASYNEKFDLLKYFDAIVSCEDVTEHKPNPETFLKCCQLLKADPQKAIVFEDGKLGLEGAKVGGMASYDVINKIYQKAE